MDAYVFCKTAAGSTRAVMDAVVASGNAARAVIVTGEHDVIARLEGIADDEILTRIEQLAAVEGVTATSTAIVVDSKLVSTGTRPPIPIPYRKPVPKPPCAALVSVTAGSGGLENALDALSQNPSVSAIAVLTGSTDFLVQISGDSFDSIVRSAIEIGKTSGVASTSTSLILDATPEV